MRSGGVAAVSDEIARKDVNNPVVNVVHVNEGKFMPPILTGRITIIEAHFLCTRFGDRRFAGASRCVLQDLFRLITLLAERAITSQQVLRKILARQLLITLRLKR